MYLEYFGLTEAPFSITPDPAFVFLSQRHRDALAHLLYGVGQGGAGGFVQLTGEVGTGKTTLCRCLLEQVPDQTQIALILNPLMTPRELLAAICEELGVETQGLEDSNKALVDRLNLFLLQAHENGERVVVVIDEAQNLSPESLEQVRLLTNLETSKQKLLQIVLLGQPELRELLQRTSLRQLAQRITARYHLTPLGVEDSASYVRHRMQVAGSVRNPFRKSALRALFQRSHGVPRLINIIADRALVGAYAGENQDINARLIHAAADEVQLGEPGARRGNWRWLLAATAGIAMAILVWSYLKPDASLETTALATANEVASEIQTTEIVSPPLEQPAVPANEAVQTGRVSTPVDEDWLAIQNQAAWQGLAALWNEPDAASVIEIACNSEARSRWACLRSDGSLARIRLLGLPVILQLSGNRAGHLLLQGIDGDQLLVGAPGTTRTIDRGNIEDRWFGTYFVAWPQSSNWPREVARGDTGPAVEMLVDLASLADSPYAGRNEFGPDFEDWLIAFQQRNGLDADGIVGPTTLLYLIRPSIPEPVLKIEWEQEN